MEFTLRALRLAKELTKKDMADSCGVHENTYSSWEENPENITLKNAKLLAEKLEVPMNTINFFCK